MGDDYFFIHHFLLQCVEHMVEFKISKAKNGSDTGADCYRINARDYFIPTQVMVLSLFLGNCLDIYAFTKNFKERLE